MKATFDQALSIGWQTERFQRTKTIKPLAEYLQTPEQRRSEGTRKLIEMAKRKAKRGGGDGNR